MDYDKLFLPLTLILLFTGIAMAQGQVVVNGGSGGGGGTMESNVGQTLYIAARADRTTYDNSLAHSDAVLEFRSSSPDISSMDSDIQEETKRVREGRRLTTETREREWNSLDSCHIQIDVERRGSSPREGLVKYEQGASLSHDASLPSADKKVFEESGYVRTHYRAKEYVYDILRDDGFSDSMHSSAGPQGTIGDDTICGQAGTWFKCTGSSLGETIRVDGTEHECKSQTGTYSWSTDISYDAEVESFDTPNSIDQGETGEIKAVFSGSDVRSQDLDIQYRNADRGTWGGKNWDTETGCSGRSCSITLEIDSSDVDEAGTEFRARTRYREVAGPRETPEAVTTRPQTVELAGSDTGSEGESGESESEEAEYDVEVNWLQQPPETMSPGETADMEARFEGLTGEVLNEGSSTFRIQYHHTRQGENDYDYFSSGDCDDWSTDETSCTLSTEISYSDVRDNTRVIARTGSATRNIGSDAAVVSAHEPDQPDEGENNFVVTNAETTLNEPVELDIRATEQVAEGGALSDGGYEIEVTGPEEHASRTFHDTERTYEFTLTTPGEYTISMKPASGIIGSVLGVDILDEETVTISAGSGWEAHCATHDDYSTASVSDKQECIEDEVVPLCFEGSTGENCEEIGESLCDYLLDYTYSTEENICVPGE